MRFYIVGLLFVLSSLSAKAETWQPAKGFEQILLWPKEVPNSLKKSSVESVKEGDKLIAGKPFLLISDVSQPTMTIYPPKGTSTGAAVVVFPGGGYRVLAIDLEGTEVCHWLNSKGITCVLLKYRVPGSGPNWDPELKRPVVPKVLTALQDAQRAMGLVRFNATKWKIDPKKIGVIGFSAGGHLVAAISTDYKKRNYPLVDDADKESCRPDFAIAGYPGHLSADPSGVKLSKLNPDIHVTKDTPPTFLVQAVDDPIDPVEFSLLYFGALKKAGVPVEMHLYAEGGHAFALRRTDAPVTRWTDVADDWLTSIGVLPKK